MPQLDIVTFVPQLFYFFIIFTVLYLLLVGYILPAISTILKVRMRILSKGTKEGSSLDNEKVKLETAGSEILTSLLNENRKMSSDWVTGMESFSSNALKTVNTNTFKDLNQTFLQSFVNT